MKDLGKYIVNKSTNIRATIQQMDKGGMGFVVVTEAERKMIGIVTNGDFRRAVLNGINLNDNVMKITNKKYKYLKNGYSKKDIINCYKNSVVECLPILEDGKLVDVIMYNDFLSKDENVLTRRRKLNLPVVIMAGGKGTRLDPITKVLPKALVPIGEKPIIEIIMDEFVKYGMKNFYISLNYKDKMIKAFFDDHEKNYNVNFISEDKPLGTAGALKFLEDKYNAPIFVINCDIIIKNDYYEILKFHNKGKYDLTIVGCMQHHAIPYGVCEIENGGTLLEFKEKPEYDFLVNTGMYLLSTNILKYIPKDTCFDMTHLINIIKEKSHNIGVYPVSQTSWIDVGQLSEYKKIMISLNL